MHSENIVFCPARHDVQSVTRSEHAGCGHDKSWRVPSRSDSLLTLWKDYCCFSCTRAQRGCWSSSPAVSDGRWARNPDREITKSTKTTSGYRHIPDETLNITMTYMGCMMSWRRVKGVSPTWPRDSRGIIQQTCHRSRGDGRRTDRQTAVRPRSANAKQRSREHLDFV